MSHVIQNTKLAYTYAQALSDTVASEAQFDLVVYELHQLTPLLSAAAATKIWSNPRLSYHHKAQLLDEVMAAVAAGLKGHQPVVSSFLGVLLQNSRMHLLPRIDHELNEMSAHRKNIKPAQLTAATSLGQEMIQAIKTAAEQQFQSKLRWRYDVDPELLAGFRIIIGHKCFDGSMRGRMQELKSYFHKESQIW